MKIFVGLGNPGEKHQGNRHNIGFMAVDELVRRHNFSPWRKRFQGEVSEGRLGSEKILALKPHTYMNESGRSVGEAMRFYKLEPADVICFYDELDLAPFKVKARIGGGAAGHNGIRSLTAHIGADFWRVRLGIGHPGDKARVHGYVLGDFAKAEAEPLDDLLRAVADVSPRMAEGDSARFMTDLALKLNPAPQRPKSKPASDVASETSSRPPQTKTISKLPAGGAPKGQQNGLAKASAKPQAEGPMADALRALKKD